MSKITIAEATNLINEFGVVLEDLYWESNSLDSKDRVFVTISLLTKELMELQKVSVQDDHYDYEVISTKASTLRDCVKDLQDSVLPEVIRVETKQRIAPFIEQSLDVFG
jgi:hypothetical protein